MNNTTTDINTREYNDDELLVALWEARERLEAKTLEKPEELSKTNETPVSQDVQQTTMHTEIQDAVREDKADRVEAQVPKNETPNLMSPEVTAGLERLLKEWPYFKGSGMLGFGPGGLEHPTFKKLADIPVRYVLTGRFDDPDQDLIAEIREYVGGWRREQNVEPQENETFEQYLRRVIAKILDTQAAIAARTSSTAA